MNAAATRRALMLAGLVSCALALTACSEQGSGPADHAHADGQTDAPAPAETGAAEPRWVYEGVLGVVTMVPEEGNPASTLKIHHEHIPGFKDPKTGELFVGASGVPGMRAMDMPMPAADGLDLSGVAVGDKVRFTLSVWTEPRQSHAVTRIETLDPATEISFEDKEGP